MENSISLKFLAKQEAMQQSSKIMENALKTIANLFNNIQMDYVNLLDDHNKLQLLVKELQQKNDTITTGQDQNLLKKPKTQSNEYKSIIKKKEIRKDLENAYNLETPSLIENTQIDEQTLSKSKIRHLNKRVNLQINIHSGNTNDIGKNKVINSISLHTQSKLMKPLSTVQVNTEMRTSTDGNISHHQKNIQKLSEEIVNIREDKKNIELDPEYVNIDATLFEEPFSQEQNLNLTPRSSKPDRIEAVQENLGKISRSSNSFVDEVVEMSPNKRMSKKRHRARNNKQAIKRCLNETAFVTTINCDGNDENLSTSKSSQRHGSKEIKTKIEDDVTKKEVKSGTQCKKHEMLSEKINNQKEALVGSNQSNLVSIVPTSVNPTAITCKSNAKIPLEHDNDFCVSKVLSRISQTEKTPDETFFVADETYFPDNETSLILNKNTKKYSDKTKRKLSDISNSPDININKVHQDQELDIGDISDWDTDVSCDKWLPSDAKKRVLLNSFDVVPVKKEKTSNFAVKGAVVRKTSARAKLRGWDCEHCEQYYNNIGLTEKELQERKNICSRHRSNYNERYYTPPGLWDLRFPDTQNSSPE